MVMAKPGDVVENADSWPTGARMFINNGYLRASTEGDVKKPSGKKSRKASKDIQTAPKTLPADEPVKVESKDEGDSSESVTKETNVFKKKRRRIEID